MGNVSLDWIIAGFSQIAQEYTWAFTFIFAAIMFYILVDIFLKGGDR